MTAVSLGQQAEIQVIFEDALEASNVSSAFNIHPWDLGYLENVTEIDRGGLSLRLSGLPKKGDVINEQPLRRNWIKLKFLLFVLKQQLFSSKQHNWTECANHQ